MLIDIVGLGAGGHAKGMIEILQMAERFNLVGLLDPNEKLHGTEILGVPVLGADDLLPKLKQEGVRHFFIGLGGSGDNTPRKRLFELALDHGIEPVDVIHSRAVVSLSAELAPGTVIMAGAVVNACSRVGQNVILNTNTVVEHDCEIGDHVHISTGANLASTVIVGDGAHIGAGAVIRQCVSIGENAIVGAGAVVVKEVFPGQVVIGSPARPLEK